MTIRQCPRCGKPVPAWQPVHGPCFRARLWQKFAIPLTLISVMCLILIGAVAFMLLRLAGPRDGMLLASMLSGTMIATPIHWGPLATPYDVTAESGYTPFVVKPIATLAAAPSSTPGSDLALPWPTRDQIRPSVTILPSITPMPLGPTWTSSPTAALLPRPTRSLPPTDWPTATLLPSPTRYLPPTDWPTSTAIVDDTAPVIGRVMAVQMSNSSNLNLRSNPDISAATITSMAVGTQVTIVDGPMEADGYTWWKITIPDGRTGWAVDEINGFQTLVAVSFGPVSRLPTSTLVTTQTCGGRSTLFSLGDRVVVSQIGDGLRIMLNPDGGARQAIAQGIPGDQFDLLEGPECHNGSWYWRAYSYTDGVTGWISEGTASEQWICPLNNPWCDR